MKTKELKEYLLKTYKRQVTLYKEAESKSNPMVEIYLSRIELLEVMFGELFDWYVFSISEKRTSPTTIYSSPCTDKIIYEWR